MVCSSVRRRPLETRGAISIQRCAGCEGGVSDVGVGGHRLTISRDRYPVRSDSLGTTIILAPLNIPVNSNREVECTTNNLENPTQCLALANLQHRRLSVSLPAVFFAGFARINHKIKLTLCVLASPSCHKGVALPGRKARCLLLCQKSDLYSGKLYPRLGKDLSHTQSKFQVRECVLLMNYL